MDVDVPLLLVPCQYQVIPEGGVPLVRVLFPQVFEDMLGVDGVAGTGLTVTDTLCCSPQQPEVFLGLR